MIIFMFDKVYIVDGSSRYHLEVVGTTPDDTEHQNEIYEQLDAELVFNLGA